MSRSIYSMAMAVDSSLSLQQVINGGGVAQAIWGEHLWVNAEGIFLGTVLECLYVQDVPDHCRSRPCELNELEGWC